MSADGAGVGPSPLLLVDAHVHVHACYALAALLTAATRNFAAAAAELGSDRPWQGVLCLTETSRADSFGMLSRCAAESRQPVPGWTALPTAEAAALVLVGDRPAARLVVIAGRQLVTAEALEVLALGTTSRYREGVPLPATVEAVLASGAAAVLPWGFGKWRGARARALADLLARPRPPALFLGDTGNRLGLLPAPTQFENDAWPVLPGSDPLPLRGEEQRVGSYGAALAGALDERHAASRLLESLAVAPPPWRTYGQKERPGRFVRNQLAMQVARRSAA